MPKHRIMQVVVVVITLLISVLLFFAPNKPEVVKTVKGEADIKIEKAVKLVMGGQQPMQGIMMLREVLQEDSMNAKAHFHLGMFSVQSGQLEKALYRFNKVTEIESGNSEAWFYLGYTHKELGDTLKAIRNYERFMTLADDEKAKAEVQKHINELKK